MVGQFQELPEFEIDDRHDEPNDTGYRAEFRKGWKAALDSLHSDREPYKAETLRKLKWNSLGYRLGRLFGNTSDEMIGLIYDWAFRQQQSAKR